MPQNALCRRRDRIAALIVTTIAVGSCVRSGASDRPALIPWPISLSLSTTECFTITKDTIIEVSPDAPELQRIAHDLAELLRPALDARLAVRPSGAAPASPAIRLEVASEASRQASRHQVSSGQAEEAYELAVGSDGVRIGSWTAAGVFYGVQTLRQLLPSSVELRGARPHTITVAIGFIADRPRFAWRGAMLDVARHFFPPDAVKRYIDLLAMYKFNRLHLHLSDDQGWRIEIAGWPNLTARAGAQRSAVGQAASIRPKNTKT